MSKLVVKTKKNRSEDIKIFCDISSIVDIQKNYSYRIVDISIGELLTKFVIKGQEQNFENDYISRLSVPQYQRDLVWEEKMQSKFIETIFMGAPIQPLFAFKLDEDGNLELLDGVKRLYSIKSFYNNELVLSGLEVLDTLNGFTYKDLSALIKRKFLNTQIKLYIVEGNINEKFRVDIMDRLNK